MNTQHTFQDLPMPEAGSTVIVGMSGGVDSTLTALLLRDAGCKVIGVTMSSWNEDLPIPPSTKGFRFSCYGPDEQIDINQCKAFCKENNIEYHVIDVRKAYQKYVLGYFRREYRDGRTPNPCVHCNQNVKFGALLEGVRALGIDFDYFCTGHYARIVTPDTSIENFYGDSSKNGSAFDSFPAMVACGTDTLKDQAYFLHRIPSDVLKKVRFPLGTSTKAETKKMAQEMGLFAASRAESQDFIPSEYFDIVFSDKESIIGDIIDIDGKKLGTHKGIEHYTIGQRRGLGVSSTKPLYVHAINKENNTVVLAGSDDLMSSELTADNWVWAGGYAPKNEFSAMAKIRLASKPCMATIIPLDTEKGNAAEARYKVIFDAPQSAIAPGQSCVAYIDGVVLGGGVICN